MVFNWGKKMVARHDDEEDMTMEEILASIRRYVADDKPTPSERPKVSEFKVTQETETVTNTIIVEPNSEKVEMPQKEAQGREEKIFELTEVVEEEVIVTPQETIVIQETIQTPIPAPAPVSRPQPIQEVRKPHIPPTQPIAKEREMHHHHSSEESMTSAQTMQASLSALSKLAEAKKTSTEGSVSQNGLTLDRLVADLARPMIKEWLDKHLASMVEKMVAKEIERITKDLQL